MTHLEENDLPSRSESSLAALDVFYEEFNEINFYVEDAEQENLYEVLLRRIYPSVKIGRIFPLGGKKAVCSHAASSDNEALTAFRAYILDRDFDHLLGKAFTHPNVFYLDRLCIENYLIEEAGIVEVVVESHPKRRRTEVSASLDMATIIGSTFNSLRPLFVYFACVQRFSLGLPNCRLAPEVYCQAKRRWEVDPTALTRYADSIVAAASHIEPPIVNPLVDSRMADAMGADDHSLVSGKHALAILFHYLKSKFSLGSITFESFVYRLAKNCTLTSFSDLSPRIIAAANAFNQCNGRSPF